MNLVLILVTSLDGVTNQGINEDHHSWTSKEDQEIFNRARDNSPLIIMGSNTYKGAKDYMVHKKGRLRIVMTHTPEKYENEKIPGKLEFTNESPKNLLQRMEKVGINEGLLAGGANLINEFLKADLINEIWITIEPWLKGEGLHVTVEKINVPLKLLSFEKINDKGTLHLKYSVVKEY